MPSITLTIKPERIALVRRLLLKLRAEELSDLRRIETQLSVYGDRRANMETEPAAITARIEALTDLLTQLDAPDDEPGLIRTIPGAILPFMPTMKAAIRERYGPPADVVELRDVERPTPGAGEVVIAVRAASINRADFDGIQPRPAFVRLFLGLRAPRNDRLGLDVAGVVDAVGPGVTRFAPDDRVFADLYPFGQGAFAEYACAPERAFAAIPDAMSFDDAATLPHSAILAVQGLRLRNGRRPRPGDRVLIDGASGNVGPFAVQIAKTLGAEVTGVCSPAKMDFVRSLGADHVLDYTTTDYTAAGERYDWIIDTDSHHPILRVRRALRPGGVYVTLGGQGLPIAAAMTLGPVVSLATHRHMGLMLWWKPFEANDLATVTAMIEAGTVKPAIDRRYPLGDVVEALRYADGGAARGKVLVTL